MLCQLVLLCCGLQYSTTQLHNLELPCAAALPSLSSSIPTWSVMGACALTPASKASQTSLDAMHGADTTWLDCLQ